MPWTSRAHSNLSPGFAVGWVGLTCCACVYVWSRTSTSTSVHREEDQARHADAVITRVL